MNINISVPSEYKIYQLPEEIKKDSSVGCLEMTISEKGNQIKVKYCLESKMLKIPVEKYGGYKKLMESAEKALKARIVLEKPSKIAGGIGTSIGS